MAAPDGEERVLMTAQHIVRSLGTTDTMTDDMLQILSKFDHRFSSMNDMNKKQESTSSQDSDYYEAAAAAADSQQQQNHSRRPSSSNVSRNNTATGSAKLRESRLDAAEDVVVRWDMGYPEQAKQQMIFECPEEEAAAYFEAVDELQYMLDSLFLQNREPETQARAQNLLQLAMERLQEEFRHLLLENSRSVDPDWLFDSLAAAEAAGSSSFQHSLDDHDDAIAAEDSSGDDNADEDVAPVATPAALVQQTTTTVVDLVHPDVVLNLGNIAQRMIAAKYQNECCQLYVNSRKTVLEESLYGLGVEKLSIDEVQKMPWETLEDKIKKWIQAMKVGVKVLFASEKLLCDQVFPTPIAETCFSDISKGAMMQLLSFGEAIAISRRSPEKLFKVLDMYETLRDLVPEINSIFCGVSGESVKSEGSGILMRLGEAARGTFAEFENAIQRDGLRTPVPGGGVHPLTRYVMNYIMFLCEYKDTLEQLFGEKKKDGSKLLDSGNGETDLLCDDGRHEGEKMSRLAVQINWLTHVLLNNLDGKSKIYKDPALTYLFLMNNVHYIVQKVKSSCVIVLIGDDWVKKQTGIVRQFATSYQRAAWIKVLSFLKDEGIHSSGSFSSGVSRVVLKDRFKNFNAAFEEAHKAQSTWVVFDPQLRDELRISIADKLLPAYRAFVGRYGNFLETGRHPDKYIKFSAEDLESAIGDFFEGSSGSLTLRRRSFTAQ